MGRELWISSATGKRRRGTTWDEISRFLDAGMTVESISEDLKCCGSDWPLDEVVRLLDRLSFDVAGVKEDEKGHVIGYVKRTSLRSGDIGEHVLEFCPQALIAYNAPLADALHALKDDKHVFVLGRKGIERIVTRADLNKPIARMYLFCLISLLEVHLSFWIERDYPSESWSEQLTRGRVKQARQRQEERRTRNQDLDFLECLQFCDKRDIALSSADIRSHVGARNTKSLKGLLKRAEALRDNLAHSQSDLAAGSTWNEILSDVCTVESLLAHSDAEAARMQDRSKS